MTQRLLIAAALMTALPASLAAVLTPTSTALVATPNPGTISGVALTATVTITSTGATATAATGFVTFYQGPNVLGIVSLSSGIATLANARLPISTAPVGLTSPAFTLSARYISGDATFATSTSAGQVVPITATPGRNFAPPAGALPTPSPLSQIARTIQADFNNDGILDFAFFSASDHSIFIYLGNGDGTMSPPPVPTLSAPNGCVDLVSSDFDASGTQDLACYTVNDQILLYFNNGAASFTTPTTITPGTNNLNESHLMMVAADFNGDGLPDLAMTGAKTGANNGDSVLILLNSPTTPGTFPTNTVNQITTTTDGSWQLTLGDFNQDGVPDIIVAAKGTSNYELYLMTGKPFPSGSLNTGVALNVPVGSLQQDQLNVLLSGDFNNDGTTDVLFRATQTGAIWVGKNLGAPPFTFVSSTDNIVNRKEAVAIGDFNGDGILDIVGHLSNNSVAIAYGKGDGTFGRPQLPAIASCSSANWPITGDYNGDHRTDFLTLCVGTAVNVQLAKVTSTTTLTVSPNPSAFGASVTLTATVSPSTATGYVTFFEGSRLLGAGVINSGIAVLSTPLLPASSLPSGTLTMSAHYVGDATLGDSTSNSVSQTVAARPGKGFSNAPNAAVLTGPQAVVVGDFNNDGNPDLAISNSTSITIELGNGDGTFTSGGAFAVQSGALLAVGDFNGDGVQDLAAMFTNNGGIGIYLGNKQSNGAGNGTFTAAPLVGTSGVALTGIRVGDFNNDGIADLVYSANNGGTAQFNFVPGKGDGTFGTRTTVNIGGVTPGQMVIADFSHDGNTDAVVPSNNASNVYSLYYLKGNGDGTFTSTNLTTPTSSVNVVQADFNGDGFADLAYSDDTGNIRIGLNNGAGAFNFGSPIASGSNTNARLAVTDFNGDGKLDLAVTLANSGQVAILLGNGSGSFTSQGPVSVGTSPQYIAIADFNGDNRADFAVSAQASNLVAVRLESGPNVTQVSPASTVAGVKNLQLTIAGTNFFSGDTVIWQPAAAGSSPTVLAARFDSSNQLTVLPSATLDALVTATGSASISVADPAVAGLVSASVPFTILPPPVISAMSPAAAAAGGTGLTLTINGQNFVAGDTVTWKPSTGAPTTGIAATLQGSTLTVQLGPSLLQTQGLVSVTVVDPSGVASGPATFAVQPPPALTILSPTSAPAGGSAFTLTITGTGFVNGDTVTWTPNGAAAQPLPNPQVGALGGQITVQVPSILLGASGTASITVIDPAGAASNSLTFSIASPIITTLNPASVGTANSDFTLVINGNNFIPGTSGAAGYSGTVVLFTDTTGAQHTLIPAAATATQLSVLISPASTLIGNVAGKAATVAVQNPPNAGQNPAGVGGAVSPPASLPVGAPAISSISPTSATVGGSNALTITITGANFVAGSGLIWCNHCNGSPSLLPAPTSITPTQIVGTVPLTLLQTVGSAQVSVSNTPPSQSNPSGSGNLTDPNTNSAPVNFQISALGISSITPTSVLAGGPAFLLTINGQNQNFDGGATVLFGNGLAPISPAQSNGSVAGNLITVTVPASYITNPGSLSVQVQNSNGATSNSVTLPIQSLSITGVTPAALVAGSPSQSVNISGTSFSNTTQIQWTQGITTTTLATTFVSPTQINAIVPQSLVLQAGSAQIVAITSVSGVNVSSAALTVTINGPAISTLTPSSSVVNGPSFALQVTGSGFLAGSVVNWTTGAGQVQALITSFVSSAQLTAIVPANLVASSGTALVTVINPGGGATGAVSNGVVFAIGPTPTINTNPIGVSVCPGGTNCTAGTAVTAGSSTVQLKLAGTNYQSGSIVVWTAGGLATNLVTAFVDDKDLAATLPANLIATPGTALLNVQNPGNATSNGVIFTVSSGTTPVLSSLNPASATAGGAGFQLALVGSSFANGAVVQWANGATTQPLTTIFQDANDLSAVVPANLIVNPGSAFVSVSSAGAVSTSLTFTINPVPSVTITSLDQSSLTAGGGAITLGINGSGFNSNSVVQWSAGAGPQALPTIFLNSTKLSALVPAALTASPGTVFVSVSNGAGLVSNTISLGINPQNAPTINVNGLNPASAVAGSAPFQLVITGTNFTSGSQVQWNSGAGPQAQATVFIDSSHLAIVVQAALVATPGTAFIDVQNPGGITSALVSFPVTSAAAPTITGNPTPASSTAGDAAFQMTLNGTNFVAGSVVQWNTGSQVVPLATTVVNATQVTAVVPANLIAAPANVFISVLNPGNLSSNLVQYTVSAAPVPAGPAILSPGGLTPSGVTAGGATFQLSITGSGFTSASVAQWVAGGSPQALTTAFLSSSQLTALVPAALIATPGTAFISVQNGATGPVSNLVSFNISAVPGPVISTTGGVLPASASTGTNGVTLAILGANFVSGSVVQWNSGGGAQALTTGFVSTTQLSALVPASLLVQPATALITVQNPDHTVSNAITFSVTGSGPVSNPTLASIAPVSAAAGSPGFTLSATGQNFVASTATASGSTVYWNGSALPTTFVSATQLNAQVDGSLLQTTGANFVTVQNGNASSSGTRFQVNGPTLAGLSPATAVAGGPSFTLTLAGTNFVAGSVAVWNGGNLPTTVNSSTVLTAQVQASLIANAGTSFVLVTNPGGSGTSPQIFTQSVPPAATVSGLNPPSAIAGGSAFQLSVIGAGFVNGSVVSWNGSALATGFVSATQITALVSNAQIVAAGTANVTVQNPGAPLSAPVAFSILGPTISSLAPATASAGDPSFTLTVTGTNFVPGSAVQWNSASLPTAYVSATQLVATVTAASVAFQGTATVTVSNPGGAISASQPFTIGPPAVSISSTSLPDGVVGTFYSQVLQAQGGTQPYTWAVTSGNLPDGILLDPASGTISGTPTGAASAIIGFTVTDSKARSAVHSLQLRIALGLTITTASPLPAAVAGTPFSVVLAANGGTPPYLWSAAGALPAGLNLNVATGEISGTPTAPGAYRFSITVTDSRGQQTVSKSFVSTVTVASLTIGGLTALISPAQQLTMSVTVGTPYTTDLTGTLTVTFTSAVGGDDPSIQFSTGGRTVNFTIPAGNTQAIFGQNQQVLLSTGTVAGTILVKASLQANASDITPSPAPQATGAVPKLAPVITSATLKQIVGGVSVGISGYATGKEVIQAVLQFNAAAGSSLTSSAVTVPLTASINAWYASAAAASFGSQFTVTIPLNVNGDVGAIGSVTVTLTNSSGTSAAVTANLQ